MTASPDWYPILLENARLLKKNPTPAERLLWAYIHKGLDGVKFRRQQIIGDYIADFASLRPRLVIELDGPYHLTESQQTADVHRTESLQRMGFTVIRFSNDELFNNINIVLKVIKDTIHNLQSVHSDTSSLSPDATSSVPSSPSCAGSSSYTATTSNPTEEASSSPNHPKEPPTSPNHSEEAPTSPNHSEEAPSPIRGRRGIGQLSTPPNHSEEAPSPTRGRRGIGLIFAAGLGTRLKPLTDTMPKALVPVAGKPLIQHVAEKLAAAGFCDLVVNVHHFADMIDFWCHAAQLQSNYMTFTLSDERKELLETGGGIKHAAPLLQDADRFLIHNVDILSNVDLDAFWDAGEGSDATLLVSERDTQRYLIFDKDMRLVGWTNIKTGEVKSPFPEVHQAFNPDYVGTVNSITNQMNPFPYTPSEHAYQLYAFAGIHQMSTSLLPLMDSWPDKFSIIDFYLGICHKVVIRGYVQPDLRLMDVGKLDTLEQAEQFIMQIHNS